MFMTEDEIFTDMLLYRIAESDKKALMETPEDDLIMYHHTDGQWIRNYYHLWDKDNPYVVGDVDVDMFPDSISQRIIERLWCHLTGKQLTFKIEVKEVSPGHWTVQKVPRS